MKVVAAFALACALLIPAAGVGAATVAAASVAGYRRSTGVWLRRVEYADDGGSWFYGQLQAPGLNQNRWTVRSIRTIRPRSRAPFLERAAPKAQAAGVHILLPLLPEGLFARPASSVPGPEGRPESRPWGSHGLHRVERAEHAAVLVAAEGCDGKDVAGPQYEALLAMCYDALHTTRTRGEM